MSDVRPRWTSVEPLGERAVLISSDAPELLGRALAQLVRAGLEVITGLTSVLVSAEDPLDDATVEELLGATRSLDRLSERRRHRIDVVLDGEDLDEAMDRTGLSFEDVARSLTEASLEVAAVGFAPGFGYLTGLEGPLAALERRATPRARVPKGSLAVAAGYAALYPAATPGGWWLLGRSSAELFDPLREEPSLLAPGDLVSVDVVDELAAPREPGRRARLAPPSGATPVLKVVHAAPGCSVVDDGRQGWGSVGVPRGGAFDPDRASLVRGLLGDAPGALEVASGGLVFDVLFDAVIAAIDLLLELDGRAIPSGVPVSIRAGSQLALPQVFHGARGYLGLANGPLIEPVLGSMSTDQLCFVGPGLLEAGDVLGARRRHARTRSSLSTAGLGVPGHLRVVRGPQEAQLVRAGGLDGLVAAVRAPSNRVGLRLEPLGGPLELAVAEVASFPVVTGAIQAPPDGSLVILGPDHATLGGYPVVGCVIGADLAKLGRLSLGDEVTFEEVSLHEARLAFDAHAALLSRSLGPHREGLEIP